LSGGGGTLGENYTLKNGYPVGDYNGDQYCTFVSLDQVCLSSVYWWGTSQNGGWSPVDHSTPSEKSQSPEQRKAADAVAVKAYNDAADAGSALLVGSAAGIATVAAAPEVAAIAAAHPDAAVGLTQGLGGSSRVPSDPVEFGAWVVGRILRSFIQNAK
jgi:hypothetical protein